ncbi:hypothetical protein DFQ28_001575 [Apophysomyces sp. BC1034]|nr:hypothetical protein DFQ30_008012 [Apophysomyces sp. BC1015]KAG0182512.1 hypothetical protein DFQ29_003738 [Apophysomyces sp. BC1021]KAG0194083.1 hypothetical protein DFQ28_001575 [Apophysomyces sp. BC1034]
MSLTIVVTGASRGLGLEFVKQLSAKGHVVIASARSPEKSDQLQELAKSKNVHTVTLDVVQEESVKAAADQISRIAPNGIDILINNSGIASSLTHNPETTSAEEYVRVFETNVAGTARVTVPFLELLRKRNTRKIINISSVMGSIAFDRGTGSLAPAYCVSKTAENMLSKMFAIHLEKEKFTVVALHPGWVQTDMGGQGADITPQQSISGMVNVIDKLTPKDNGAFFDYEGKVVPW